MRAIEYMKVDWMRVKHIAKYIIVGGLIFIVAILNSGEKLVTAGAYLLFLVTILSAQTFSLDRTSESGFINMLPGTTLERVAGRFCYTFTLFLAGGLCTLVIGILSTLLGTPVTNQEVTVLVALFGSFFLVASLQSCLFFAIGQVKSVQLLGIIQMLPAFIMFFGFSYLRESLFEDPQQLEKIFTWIMEHQIPLAIGIVAAGMVVFIASLAVSVQIMEKRDFA